MTNRNPSAKPGDSDTVHTSETPTAKDDSADVKSDDSADVKSDDGAGLYVIVATTREGQRLVELCDHEQAEARYHQLTYRGEPDGNGNFTGGGSHEIPEKDVTVYRLTSTEHHFG